MTTDTKDDAVRLRFVRSISKLDNCFVWLGFESFKAGCPVEVESVLLLRHRQRNAFRAGVSLARTGVSKSFVWPSSESVATIQNALAAFRATFATPLGQRRVGVVGSRGFKRLELVASFVRELPVLTTVVTGGAFGVDKAAEKVARENELVVEVVVAGWGSLGRAAGPERNARLVAMGLDRLVTFWDGDSPGTLDVACRARAAKVPVEDLGESTFEPL